MTFTLIFFYTVQTSIVILELQLINENSDADFDLAQTARLTLECVWVGDCGECYWLLNSENIYGKTELGGGGKFVKRNLNKLKFNRALLTLSVIKDFHLWRKKKVG